MTIISQPFYYFLSVVWIRRFHETDRIYNGRVTAVRTGETGNALHVYE